MIIQSALLNRFSDVVFGFSGKAEGSFDAPFYWNMSLSVGDDPNAVKANRKLFFERLGLGVENVALQKQVHGDVVAVRVSGGTEGETDAMVTNVRGLGLGISSADCTPIFIYDPVHKAIGAVHSGWKGTELKIVEKTFAVMNREYGTEAGDVFVYIGPSITRKNYEVGEEFLDKFPLQFFARFDNKLLLDVAGINYAMLRDLGVPIQNIQHSTLCSYEFNHQCHSYRRDGITSGRALGVIALRG